MRKSFFAHSIVAVLLCLAGRGAAQASDITGVPTDWSGITLYANWYYGCEYEWGCGGYFEYPTAGNYLEGVGPEEYVSLNMNGTPGAEFSYGEVDDANGNPLDFVAFSNGYDTGPVTFTFDDDTTVNPITIQAFATDLYGYDPFTATVSAYNSNGQLLGTTSFSSVENDSDTYLFAFQPTYSAFVGISESNVLNTPDIASVVISTDGTEGSSNWFGTGALGVGLGAPEPGAFALTLLGVCLLVTGRVGAGRRAAAVQAEARNASPRRA
jgi:hypothetical protein